MRRIVSPYLILIFWVGLVLATYRDIAELYIALMGGLTIFLKKKKVEIKAMSVWWYIFVIYYLLISIIGIFTGNVSIKQFAEFIIKYLALPFVVYMLLPIETENLEKTLIGLKTIIFFCAFYGVIEQFFKYNSLVDFVIIESKSWMIEMNRASNYQVSSFFLHYNYYGVVLAVGWIISWFYPYKNKILEFIFRLLVIEQIFFCQSRICWITFIIVLMIYTITNGKIKSKKIRYLSLAAILGLSVALSKPIILIKIWGFIYSRFSRLFIYGFKDGSLGQRVGTLMNWPIYFLNNILIGIFGSGYQSINGEFMEGYSYFSGYPTADCQLTVYLVEVGICGIIILCVAIIKTLLSPNDGKKNIRLKKYGVVVFLIEMITLDMISNNIMLVLLYILLMLDSGYKKQEKFK